jgi:hypothetical protein
VGSNLSDLKENDADPKKHEMAELILMINDKVAPYGIKIPRSELPELLKKYKAPKNV